MDAEKAQLRRQFRAGRAGEVAGEALQLLSTSLRAGLLPTGTLAPTGHPGGSADHLGGPARPAAADHGKPPSPAHGEGATPLVASYVPATGEPDVRGVNRAVRAAGGGVLLPVPRPDRLLDWARDDGHYATSPLFPVPVPTTAVLGTGGRALLELGTRLVLVPALAADESGTRLGQGGGYYDRLLAELDGRVPALVVVRDAELLAAGTLPRRAHDQAVAGALTPTRVVWFSG